MSVIAATTSGARVKPSWLAKRAARSMRRGSSSKEACAVPGVRRTAAARSSSPPYGSTNASGAFQSGSATAIALTAKSRRARSSLSESPKVTSGLREVRSYASAR